MKRLTTDEPMSNSERIVNFAYAKDGEIYVRWFDGKRDVNINDIVRYLATNFDCTNILDDVDDNEIFEVLIDELGSHYYSTVMLALATQAAELRGMLKQYEDAEENGLLPRLPCKVGDTVYYVPPSECREGAGEYIVTGFCFDKGGCQIRTYNPKGVIIYFYLDYIGKTVFLTREEAMQALKARDSK